MKSVGIVLALIGCLFLTVALVNAPKAENISYFVGTTLPGLLLLIVGLKLARSADQSAEDRPDKNQGAAETHADLSRRLRQSQQSRVDAFRTSATLGIAGGILLMFLGSGLTQSGVGIDLGLIVALGGYVMEIWGCVNYMRWKGYSGWFGLFGYLLLPGILILVLFPNRRQRAILARGMQRIEDVDDFSKMDRRPSYPFLLTLAPLAVIAVVLGGLMYSIGSDINPAEWQEVVHPEAGFRALMPGSPRIVQDIKETPAGKIELYKFLVEPKGKKEVFMVVSVRFPDEIAKEMGGVDKLLELGRQDLLSASQGQIKDERQIAINDHPALEMEVLPPKGAIIKARVLATKNQVYEISVHVPLIRLESLDVRKFLESFRLLADNEEGPGR